MPVPCSKSKKLIVKRICASVALMVSLVLFSFSCSRTPSGQDLAISEYDIKPAVLVQNVQMPSDSIFKTDSLVFHIGTGHFDADMEYAYCLSLSDYAANASFTPYDTLTSILFANLSDNLPGQLWRLSVVGRYSGNTTGSDTVNIVFGVSRSKQSVQLSPSFLAVNAATDRSFYLDVTGDDIDETVLAAAFSVTWDSSLVSCDSVVFPAGDPLSMFRETGGQVLMFGSIDSVRTLVKADLAVHSGSADGAGGSGKLGRVHFKAKKSGFCRIRLASGALKDSANRDVGVGLSDAAVAIHHQEIGR